jgi:gamma-glutamylcyclotransferase (GGCT)/AIG2-like uncharacterized protein YtfP
MTKHHQTNSVISADRIFYWAYGSNLSERQMNKRCPRAIKYGPMSVKDCALVFRGVADVTLREGSTTPGGLWQITAECERELDVFEGVASRIYMKRYFRISIEGKKYTCLFYQMRSKEGIMPPSETYLDTIVRGYADFELCLDPLDVALQESWGNKQLTEHLLDRHERRGSPRLARSLPGLIPRTGDLLPLPMWNDVGGGA